jgi:aldehyde dehydrogenase family 7 protein A1
VFMWNAAIALVCGNLVLWKNAPTASLVTIATTNIILDVLLKNKISPAVVTTVQGDIDVGEKMVSDRRVPLVSFTGSTKIGKIIQAKVAERFGRTILELGGNNCTIILQDANVELAFKACTFAAVGTCGQRCTTLRRLLIHESLYDAFVERLTKAYATICVGDPLDEKTLCGPLHSQMSVDIYTKGL